MTGLEASKAKRRNTSLRISDEEIWFWYCHHEKRLMSEMTITAYAKKHGISIDKFLVMSTRIMYCQKLHPEKYIKIIEVANRFLDSGFTLDEFCRKNEFEFPKHVISFALTHLKYRETIERLKQSGRKLDDNDILIDTRK